MEDSIDQIAVLHTVIAGINDIEDFGTLKIDSDVGGLIKFPASPSALTELSNEIPFGVNDLYPVIS